MPYGRNNNEDMEEEEIIEVSSPACYMGIVDWDYGFDNFFSKDIANRRRSCQKQKSKQPELEIKHEERRNAGASGTSSTACSNSNNSSNNSSNTNSCENNQGSTSTSTTAAASEPQQSKQQQEHQQQSPDQKETNKEQQKQQDPTETSSILSNTIVTATIATPTCQKHNNGIFEIKEDDDGMTEGFSDYFGDNVDGEEWLEGDIFDEEDEFGELTEFQENELQYKDTYSSDLLHAWEKVLTQVYLNDNSITGDGHDKSIPSHGPKSIRYYVLEEAHESVHSKVTWTSVTYSMDQDTGTARVKWPHSKIEEMYLNALDCERLQTTAPFEPAMLSVENEDDRSSSDDDDDDDDDIIPPISSTSIPEFQRTPSTVSYTQPSTTANTSIKSPIFGGFSFSKFLPRLSTTSLPRSDSSAPTSATSTERNSFESIPRMSNGTGTISPAKNLSRTSSPIPYPMASPSPSSSIMTGSSMYTENFNSTLSTSPTTTFYQNENIIPKSSIRAKRYSMPVTTSNYSDNNKKPLPNWKSSVPDKTDQAKEENQSSVSQRQQRRRPMTMIDTTLANKSSNILDLDDISNTTIVSTPPPSSRSFSFTPLVPTPTRPTSFVPLVPTPTRATTTMPITPKMHEQQGKYEDNEEKLGDLRDLIIGSVDPRQQKQDLSSSPLCGAQEEVYSDMEFGEFAEAADDGFDDFVLSNEQEQEDEWGDWNGCNTTTTVISSH